MVFDLQATSPQIGWSYRRKKKRYLKDSVHPSSLIKSIVKSIHLFNMPLAYLASHSALSSKNGSVKKKGGGWRISRARARTKGKAKGNVKRSPAEIKGSGVLIKFLPYHSQFVRSTNDWRRNVRWLKPGTYHLPGRISVSLGSTFQLPVLCTLMELGESEFRKFVWTERSEPEIAGLARRCAQVFWLHWVCLPDQLFTAIVPSARSPLLSPSIALYLSSILPRRLEKSAARADRWQALFPVLSRDFE